MSQPSQRSWYFDYYASNCQVMRFPLCRALTDSSPPARFMGVRTFLSVTSNWRTVPLACGPRPWLPPTGLLSFCAKDNEPLLMNYPTRRPSYKVEPTVFLLGNQHVLSKHRCVFNQFLRENYLSRAVNRANIQLCQG